MTSSRSAAALEAASSPAADPAAAVEHPGAGVDPRRILAAIADRLELIDPEGLAAVPVAGGGPAACAGVPWIERWAPEARAGARAALGAARAGGAARFQAALGDGDEVRWWDVAVTPVPSADGGIERLLVASRDVTDLHRARERAEREAAATSRANEELERFAHGAAHDLQEPLRMVSNYVHLLQSRYAAKLDDRARHYMGFAIDGAMRMQRLIRSLLEYARHGRSGEPETDVALADAVGEAVAELSAAIAASGARIEVDALPAARGPRGQFIQLFRHLLDNAITYRRPDSAPVIRVDAARDAAGWTIAVRDNGIGVAPEHRERVFEAFKRLHSRDQFPGAGIGLALCRRIVTGRGGWIWMEETPGGGATVRLTLPVPPLS